MGGWMIAIIVLAVLCLALALLHWRDQRAIRQLEANTENFLNHAGPPLDLALGEDSISRLQNTLGELQNRFLRARELQMEERTRAKNLTADISHQLKTPLTTLRLYTEMDAAPHMQAELEQISRMENLIQSLLRLERLCADGYHFSFAVCSAAELVAEQWSFLAPSYPGRELHILRDAAIHCDRKWLGEAFLNLLKNACEHTPPGGEIRVELDRTERAFLCTLEDSGGGVRETELPRLFDRFYRGEHSNPNGAGIGLAIVREIIRRHHGTITAANTARGLKMEITLPVLEEYLTNS